MIGPSTWVLLFLEKNRGKLGFEIDESGGAIIKMYKNVQSSCPFFS
jgi:hypothetical protein